MPSTGHPKEERSDFRTAQGGAEQPQRDRDTIADALSAFAEQQHADNEEHADQAKKELKWNRATAIGVWVYTIVTFGLLIFAVVQFGAAQRFNKQQLRAFVYFDKPSLRPFQKALVTGGTPNKFLAAGQGQALVAGDYFSIVFPLVNSGSTAAVHVKVLVSCPPANVAPSEPFTLFKWDTSAAIQEVIGPKQTIEIDGCELSSEDLSNTELGNAHRYLLGEVQYQDAVDEVRHLTQLARELVIWDFFGDPSKLRSSTVARGQHNCGDEDCATE